MDRCEFAEWVPAQRVFPRDAVDRAVDREKDPPILLEPGDSNPEPGQYPPCVGAGSTHGHGPFTRLWV